MKGAVSENNEDMVRKESDLGEVPKEKGRPRCWTCGKHFLCLQTRSAHEFIAHGHDGSRPELGDRPMTRTWALAKLEEADRKAQEVWRSCEVD